MSHHPTTWPSKRATKLAAAGSEQTTVEVEGLFSGWYFGERYVPPLSRYGVDRFAQLLEVRLRKWDDFSTHGATFAAA